MANNVVPFGKYKGQPVEAMAADQAYMDWLLAQPWFKDQYKNVYTLIVNNFTEPNETPEHNALQVLFLNDDFAKKVVMSYYAQSIHDALWRREHWGYWREDYELTKLRFEVGFEVMGADVYIRWEYQNADYNRWSIVDGAQFKVEIKPSVGDDYPAVLRQMKNIQCTGRPILFLDRYIGVGATEEQFIRTFNRAGIVVVFCEDVMAAQDRPVIKEMCDKVNEARLPFSSRWSMRALSAELVEAIEDQERLLSEAIRDGDDEDIRIHGEAMVRGWQAANRQMEEVAIDAAKQVFPGATVIGIRKKEPD